MGGCYGFIQRAMQIVEPRTLRRAAHIVEIGKRAGLEDSGSFFVARQDAVGEAGDDLGDVFNEVGRVQPGIAFFDEFACGGGDRLGVGIGGVRGCGEIG
jgi:hypothetical protein